MRWWTVKIIRRVSTITPCYICGSGIEEPRLDHRDMKLRPCAFCESIIQEAVEEMNKDQNTDDEFFDPIFGDEEFDEEDLSDLDEELGDIDPPYSY